MAWRGSTTVKERILAALPYLIPVLEVYPFGGFLLQQIPILQLLFLPLLPLMPIYYYSVDGWDIVSMALFFGLFIGVVRDYKINRFIRFNTMQALLLAIVVFLFSAIARLMGLTNVLNIGFSVAISAKDSYPILLVLLFNTVFIGIVVGSVYGAVQSLRGMFAHIPVISEAADAQTRY